MKPLNIIKEIAPGVSLPLIGFGCYLIPTNEEGRQAMESAVSLGYRHFDTAQFYENEALLGSVLNTSSIPRKEFFVTSKVAFVNAGYQKTKRSTAESIQHFGYLDLMLIHWPGNKLYPPSDPRNKEIRKETWLALQEFVKEGSIRAIGVSNFLPRHMEEIKNYTNVKLACNQFELHPLYQDKNTIKYCEDENIQIMAYRSLLRNEPELMENPVVKDIAQKNQRTVGEVLLRWAVSHDYAVIPKSVNKSRQERNIRILEFDLDQEDIKALDGLNKMKKFAWDPKSVA